MKVLDWAAVLLMIVACVLFWLLVREAEAHGRTRLQLSAVTYKADTCDKILVSCESVYSRLASGLDAVAERCGR
jgi:lipopolysaccharide export system protein LptC